MAAVAVAVITGSSGPRFPLERSKSRELSGADCDDDPVPDAA